MKPCRYFAIIYLQSPTNRKTVASEGDVVAEHARFLNKHVKAKYPEAEAVFATSTAVIFALMDTASASGVFKNLTAGLKGQDQLSVVQVGKDIVATHQGLMTWHSRTVFLTS